MVVDEPPDVALLRDVGEVGPLTETSCLVDRTVRPSSSHPSLLRDTY